MYIRTIFKSIFAVLLSASFMMSLTSCTVSDLNNKDDNTKILEEYNKACEYALKHADKSTPNHAGEADVANVLSQTEITPEAARTFKKLHAGNLICEPVVFLDSIVEGPEGIDAYLCKTAPEHTNEPDDPYWSLITISEDSKEFRECIILDIPASVLQETIYNEFHNEYRNFGSWNFPKTYELSPELTECFNIAVDNDENNGFRYTPLVKMGSVGYDSVTAYAVLALKELKDSEYKCFCVVYLEKYDNGETIFLNSSLVVY